MTLNTNLKIVAAMLAIAVPSAASLAAPKSPRLARCDGKHRRPANPYGSILPTVAPTAAITPPESAAPVDLFPRRDQVRPGPRLRGKHEEQRSPVEVPSIGVLSLSTYRSC